MAQYGTNEPHHARNRLRARIRAAGRHPDAPHALSQQAGAITGAFLDRFAIGFLICVVDLPWPGWCVGLIVALLVSLPSAVVTKSYAPILGVGGIIIGIIRARFGH